MLLKLVNIRLSLPPFTQTTVIICLIAAIHAWVLCLEHWLLLSLAHRVTFLKLQSAASFFMKSLWNLSSGFRIWLTLSCDWLAKAFLTWPCLMLHHCLWLSFPSSESINSFPDWGIISLSGWNAQARVSTDGCGSLHLKYKTECALHRSYISEEQHIDWNYKGDSIHIRHLEWMSAITVTLVTKSLDIKRVIHKVLSLCPWNC